MKPTLTKWDLEEGANLIGCEPAHIFAVTMVESGRRGFIKGTDTPIIKWEGHYFSRLTGGRFDKKMPGLSHRKWTERFTLRSLKARHRRRLQVAVALEDGRWKREAFQSCSWGRFQIMGANYKHCGAESLQEFINWMFKSERHHLKAFIGFVKHKHIDDDLRRGDWRGFARVYNGRSYAKHNYHGKMAHYYNNYDRLVNKYFI